MRPTCFRLVAWLSWVWLGVVQAYELQHVAHGRLCGGDCAFGFELSDSNLPLRSVEYVFERMRGGPVRLIVFGYNDVVVLHPPSGPAHTSGPAGRRNVCERV